MQTVQPRYGDCELSGWLRDAVMKWLEDRGINVSADTSEYTDHWEIDANEAVAKAAKTLREDPDDFNKLVFEVLKRDIDYDYAADLAALLEEGMETSRRNNYSCIAIDWW